MTEDRLNRLNLFEAVVFAIYGNWLISFLSDKISFSKAPKFFNVFGDWYQAVCVGFAFACLLILFAYAIYKPNTVTKGILAILYAGHIIGIYGAFFVEEFTMSNIVFVIIGFALYIITFFLELERIKLARIKTANILPAPSK
jgi:hypothetical protein